MKELIENCFRLPWTSKDNPNGWIEPTTFCQIKCPGCYRGIDRADYQPYHEELVTMTNQIDWLIANRNIQTLSIAGGDPLLYPKLKELVLYAAFKGLRIMINTNGFALDEKLLIELKNWGVTQVLIHIDRYQIRNNKRLSENDIISIRENFCVLFRKIKDINLGFIQMLSADALQDLEKDCRYFTANRDVINLVVFTLYQEIFRSFETKSKIDASVSIVEVVQKLTLTNFFKPSAYLPGKINKTEPAWLFSLSIGNSSHSLGFLDKTVYRRIQKRYYKRKEKHFFILRNNEVKLSGMLKLSGYKSILTILLRIFSDPFHLKKKLYYQTCLIIRGPVKNNDQWDTCDGCPDAILNGEELVPSCLLSEYK